jgi:[ribosomal protein S5]-alanine N-acetyltransferase
MVTEDSFIDFKCPSCSEPVSFPQDCAGKAQECPTCGESLVVPASGSEAARKIPLPITTDRLILRRFRGGDWQDLLALMSDEELLAHVESRPLGEDEILRWLESDQHVKLTTPNQPFYLGLENKEAGKLIGFVHVAFTEPQRHQANLALFVNRAFQRRGLASEALAAALRFCLRDLGLHRVTAYCDSRNTAACRLFEKAGLRREGEFRKDRLLNQEWINTLWYALLKEEYQ